MKGQGKFSRRRGELKESIFSNIQVQADHLKTSLERDFCCLLDFERNVSGHFYKAVSVEYVYEGMKQVYTPEFCIRYTPEENPRIVLAAVIFRDELRSNWQALKPKFKAAKQYAQQRGWGFKIYTEDEIELGAYLYNVKFLLFYRKNANLPNIAYRRIILSIMEAVKISTPAEVILLAFRDQDRRAELIPTLWHMVATGLVGCNLLEDLTMSSEIWCKTD